jgi:GNAT superfamily N-acetyltransferase
MPAPLAERTRGCHGDNVATSLLPSEGDHLSTGWEPDVPPDDTLVRQAVLAHASWATTLARNVGRPWHTSAAWAGGRVGDRGAMTNWVVLTHPLDDPAAVLAEVAGLFPVEIPYLLVSAWPTPDLRPHGLGLVGHPPLMVHFPARVLAGPGTDGPGSAAQVPSDRVIVREVQDHSELALAEQVLVEGYPLPEMEPLSTGDLYGPGLLDASTRVWLAWDGDTPVGTATAHRHGDVVLVESVATLAQARGRGVGAAVTWAATCAEPGRPALLIASDDGRPVYERLGYLPVERWTVWLQPGSA